MNFIQRQNVSTNTEYWNGFYKNNEMAKEINTPSQFAAFCIGEMRLNGISLVYDLGCGNGRDAKFFIEQDCDVIAFDASVTAIQKTINQCGPNSRLSVQVTDFAEPQVKWPNSSKKKKALYARFLIHSLSDEALKTFITKCEYCMNAGDLAFFEYRTTEDKSRFKEAPDHYRNFVDPNFIEKHASKNGLILKYSVQGLGFAKYRDDDAFVARQIFYKK